MQSKLNPKQVARVSEKFRDHPLLLACRKAFGCYEADLQGLLIAPEEIFLESAIILDDLLTDSDNAAEYVKNLWYQEKVKIKRWEPQAPQDSLDKVVGAIMFVVAGVLCLHWNSKYNEDIKDQVFELARKNMSIDTVEENRIIDELSRSAEGLDKWLFVYMESEDLLSDEIVESLQEPKIIVKNPMSRRPKKAKDVPLIDLTFNYNKDGKDDLKNRILSVIFEQLKANRLVASDCDQKHFIELFQGGRCHNKVAWIGRKNMLHYIFDEWVNKRKYIEKPAGAGLWQIVAAHFFIQKTKAGEKESVSLTADDLKDAGNPQNPNDEIESIIELLNPQTINKAIKKHL